MSPKAKLLNNDLIIPPYVVITSLFNTYINQNLPPHSLVIANIISLLNNIPLYNN